ncbi:MAG: 30S ribosomal protein S6 [Chloroflexi bacterium]|nr:30S ribosomal protein S6 [Chloroflexota bacterium]
MTRSYELTFIVKPDVDATNLTAIIDRVKEFITAEGGTITKVDQWGLRRLMYPIRKYREGHYVFALVQLDAPSIARIESRLRLTEDVIRYLLIRADETAPAAVEPAATEPAQTEAVAPAVAEPEAAAPASEPAPDTTTT